MKVNFSEKELENSRQSKNCSRLGSVVCVGNTVAFLSTSLLFQQKGINHTRQYKQSVCSKSLLSCLPLSLLIKYILTAQKVFNQTTQELCQIHKLCRSILHSDKKKNLIYCFVATSNNQSCLQKSYSESETLGEAVEPLGMEW